MDHDFDVHAYTETWFDSDDDSNLTDLDYYSNINCIPCGLTGGGTSLFICPKYNFIRKPDLKSIPPIKIPYLLRFLAQL